MRHTLSYILCYFVFIIPAFPQGGWQLKRNENGIKVYTRKPDGDKFRSVRVQAELKGTVQEIKAILMDAERHKDWVYGTKTAYVLKRPDPGTVIYYTEIALPWPASNRDLIIKLSTYQDSPYNLHVRAESIDFNVAPKANLVRVPSSLALWDITTLPGHKLQVTYTFKVDPGGALPAWLVNMAAVTGPYESFRKLNMLLQTRQKTTDSAGLNITKPAE